jgi:hypothetical protein
MAPYTEIKTDFTGIKNYRNITNIRENCHIKVCTKTGNKIEKTGDRTLQGVHFLK